MDCCTRTWDLPTGSLVDCFATSSPVTSVTLSPLGEYLATTHVDDLGIYLWSNMTLYTHVALRPLPADYTPQLLEAPTTSRQSKGKAEIRPSQCFQLDNKNIRISSTT